MSRSPLLSPYIISQKIMQPSTIAGAETSSPDNKPICPDLVILWNREINTCAPGKHPAFSDYGTNGPRWAGQANILTMDLWFSLPHVHGMCICTHTFMHTVYMYMHIQSSFLWVLGYS